MFRKPQLNGPGHNRDVAVLVDRATHPDLLSEDLQSSVALCDIVKRNVQHEAADAVRLLRSKIRNKNPRVQLLGLELLQTLMQNTGPALFQEVITGLLADVSALASSAVNPTSFGKNVDVRVQERASTLIEQWGRSFEREFSLSRRFPAFVRAFRDLQEEGVIFPGVDLGGPPLFTPPEKQSRPSVEDTEKTLRKLQGDLVVTLDNSKLLCELCEGGEENDAEMLRGIAENVQQMAKRVRKLQKQLDQPQNEHLAAAKLDVETSMRALKHALHVYRRWTAAATGQPNAGVPAQKSGGVPAFRISQLETVPVPPRPATDGSAAAPDNVRAALDRQRSLYPTLDVIDADLVPGAARRLPSTEPSAPVASPDSPLIDVGSPWVSERGTVHGEFKPKISENPFADLA